MELLEKIDYMQFTIQIDDEKPIVQQTRTYLEDRDIIDNDEMMERISQYDYEVDREAEGEAVSLSTLEVPTYAFPR